MLLHFEISPSFDIGLLVYIFSFFCFDTLTFPIVAKFNVLTSQSFDDILYVVYGLKTKKETNTHSHVLCRKNKYNSVIFRARLHFSLH